MTPPELDLREADPALIGAVGGAAAILGAFGRLFVRMRREEAKRLIDLLNKQYPEEPAGSLKAITRGELDREREFERKVKERLSRDLPEAFKIEDPGKRSDRINQIVERERRYLQAREDAMTSRALHAVSRHSLKRVSPEGAYWTLSPDVKKHTLDCIMLAHHFWPWEVLDELHPPLHHGCACDLISKHDAISQGLMTEADVPDTQDAIRRARDTYEWAKSIEHAAMDDEVYVFLLDLEEGYDPAKHPRDRHGRWKRTNNVVRKSVAKALKDAIPDAPVSPVQRRTEGRGGWRWAAGRRVFIPQHRKFERRIGAHVYMSPTDSTILYRDGKRTSDRVERATEPGALARPKSPGVHSVIEKLRPEEQIELAPLPTGRAKLATTQPRDWVEFCERTQALAEALAQKYHAPYKMGKIIYDPKSYDHSGFEDWEGNLYFGGDVLPAVEDDAKRIDAGRKPTGRELELAYGTYRIQAHEASHAVNGADEEAYTSPAGFELEEGLTEKVAHILARENLAREGRSDVILWADQHPDSPHVWGTYQTAREHINDVFNAMKMPPEDRDHATLHLKFEVPPDERVDALVDMSHQYHSIDRQEVLDLLSEETSATPETLASLRATEDPGVTLGGTTPGGVEPWRPGTQGKGGIYDGKVYTWRADHLLDRSGFHHRQAQALGKREAEFWITPTGQYKLLPRSIDGQHPGRWQRRVDHTIQQATGFTPLDPGSFPGEGPDNYPWRNDPGVAPPFPGGVKVIYGENGVHKVIGPFGTWDQVANEVVSLRKAGATDVRMKAGLRGDRPLNVREQGHVVKLATERLVGREPYHAPDAFPAGHADPGVPAAGPTVTDPRVPSTIEDAAAMIARLNYESGDFTREKAERSADLFGLKGAEREALIKNLSPSEEQMRESWEERLRGATTTEWRGRQWAWSDDALARSRVARAMIENDKNEMFRAAEARFGPSVALVVKSPNAWDDTVAQRSGVVTAVADSQARVIRMDGYLYPSMGSAANAGLPAVLRHEYAHRVWDRLDRDSKQRFIDSLPPRAELPDALADSLTTYAGTTMGERALPTGDSDEDQLARELNAATGEGQQDYDEVFAETFAIGTDPRYKPDEWRPWVQESIDTMRDVVVPAGHADPGVTPTTYYHGTSARSAARMAVRGLDADRVFMATDKREDAIGSDDDEDGQTVVEVVAQPKNPIHVTVPPLAPGEAAPWSVGAQAFREIRRDLGIKLPADWRDHADSPSDWTVQELRRRGHDAAYVDLPQLHEKWIMAWDPEAVRMDHIPGTKLPTWRRAGAIYDGFEHNGLRAQLDEDDSASYSEPVAGAPEDTRVRAVGPIKDTATGKSVGWFERDFKQEEGKLVVHHSIMSIDPAYEHHGFATALNKHAEEEYRKLGVDEIRLYTKWVGGYAWARAGYDFDLEHYAGAPDYKTVEGWLVEQREGWQEVVPERLREPAEAFNAMLQLGDFKTPAEIANYGRKSPWTVKDDFYIFGGNPSDQFLVPKGTKMWLGKLFMLGTEWNGVKHLSGIEEAVTPEALATLFDQTDLHVPPDSIWADDEDAFWDAAELQEAFDEVRHPRDRLGRWRKKADADLARIEKLTVGAGVRVNGILISREHDGYEVNVRGDLQPAIAVTSAAEALRAAQRPESVIPQIAVTATDQRALAEEALKNQRPVVLTFPNHRFTITKVTATDKFGFTYQDERDPTKTYKQAYGWDLDEGSTTLKYAPDTTIKLDPEVANLKSRAAAELYLQRLGIREVGFYPEENEEALKEAENRTGLKHDTLDMNATRQIVQATKDALERYPVLRTGPHPLEGIGTDFGVRSVDRAVDRYWGTNMRAGVWATTGPDPRDGFMQWGSPNAKKEGGTWITINDFSRDLNNDDLENARNGSLSYATRTIYGRMMHELGHAVIAAAGDTSGQSDFGWTGAVGAKTILTAHMFLPGDLSAISKYAASNPEEGWAEVFATKNTPGATELASPLGQRLVRDLTGAHPIVVRTDRPGHVRFADMKDSPVVMIVTGGPLLEEILKRAEANIAADSWQDDENVIWQDVERAVDPVPVVEAHHHDKRAEKPKRRGRERPPDREFEKKHPRGRGGRFGDKGGKPVQASPGRPNTHDPALIRAALANPKGPEARRLNFYLGGPFKEVLAREGAAHLRAALGDHLTLSNESDPKVQQVLVQLGLFPASVWRALAARGFDLCVGTRPVTDYPPLAGYDPNESLRGHSDSADTLGNVGGIFIGSSVLVNAGSTRYTWPVALHEVGHALQTLLLGGTPPELHDAWVRDAPHLDPYYQQGDGAGTQEFFAQSLQDYFLGGKEQVAKTYDPAYADWLDRFVTDLSTRR